MDIHTIFDDEELSKFVSAANVGGLRKDSKYNAFDILADNDEDELLNKYEALNEKEKKEIRKYIRESVKDYRNSIHCDDDE